MHASCYVLWWYAWLESRGVHFEIFYVGQLCQGLLHLFSNRIFLFSSTTVLLYDSKHGRSAVWFASSCENASMKDIAKEKRVKKCFKAQPCSCPYVLVWRIGELCPFWEQRISRITIFLYAWCNSFLEQNIKKLHCVGSHVLFPVNKWAWETDEQLTQQKSRSRYNTEMVFSILGGTFISSSDEHSVQFVLPTYMK